MMQCPRCQTKMRARVADQPISIPIWFCTACSHSVPRKTEPVLSVAAPSPTKPMFSSPQTQSSKSRAAKTKEPFDCPNHPGVELVLSDFKSSGGRRIYHCPVPKCNHYRLKEKKTPKREHDLTLTPVRFNEHEEQTRLFQEVNRHKDQYPTLGLLYAIPNGGYRPRIVAARLKKEGVKAGVPDTHYPVARGGYYGWWGELKIEHGGTLRSHQSDWLLDLRDQGHYAEVFHGWKAAWSSLLAYEQGLIKKATTT